MAELLEGALFGARGAVEITLAKRLLRFIHGLLGAPELRGRLHAELLHALAELAELVTQLALPTAEFAATFARLLATATLALLTLLAALIA